MKVTTTVTIAALCLVAALTGCTNEEGPTMTATEARDSVIALVEGTMRATQTTGWTVQAVYPGECGDGVTFGFGGFTQTLGTDAAADARRVADYWQTQGLTVRVVDEPTPVVFGNGGPVNAISFSTKPTYAIDAGGVCVPGDPDDYVRLPVPTIDPSLGPVDG